jgi:hypothetical protein
MGHWDVRSMWLSCCAFLTPHSLRSLYVVTLKPLRQPSYIPPAIHTPQESYISTAKLGTALFIRPSFFQMEWTTFNGHFSCRGIRVDVLKHRNTEELMTIIFLFMHKLHFWLFNFHKAVNRQLCYLCFMTSYLHMQYSKYIILANSFIHLVVCLTTDPQPLPKHSSPHSAI